MPMRRPSATNLNTPAGSYQISIDTRAENEMNPVDHWVEIDETEIGDKVIQNVLADHSPILEILGLISETPVYIAGSQILGSIPSLGVQISENTDIDIFIQQLSEQELERLETQINRLGGTINLKPSRGDPENRRVIEIVHNGKKFQVTEFKGDFLQYSMQLISGQVVLEYSRESIKLLTVFEDIANLINNGYMLPFHENNFLDSEWVYSALRYICEVSMHSRIYPDPIVLRIIREVFSNINLARIQELQIHNIEHAFMPKLKESFDRIQNSNEKDSRLFLSLLGYVHIFRALLPITWTLAHLRQPSLYDVLDMKTFSYEDFYQAFNKCNTNHISQDVLDLAELTRQDINSMNLLSIKLNRRILIASNKNHFVSALRSVRRLLPFLVKPNEAAKPEEIFTDLNLSYDEFLLWRSVHVWENNEELMELHPDYYKFAKSHSEQLKLIDMIQNHSGICYLFSFLLIRIIANNELIGIDTKLKREVYRKAIIYHALDLLGFYSSESKTSFLHDFSKITGDEHGVIEFIKQISEGLSKLKVLGLSKDEFVKLNNKQILDKIGINKLNKYPLIEIR